MTLFAEFQKSLRWRFLFFIGAIFSFALLGSCDSQAQALSPKDPDSIGFTFLGQALALDDEGRRVGGYQLLTPSGYFITRLADGSVGRVSEVYYENMDCSGQRYVSEASPNKEIPAIPGMVFIPIDTDSLYYIPFDASPVLVRTTSRAVNKDGLLICEPLDFELFLYLAIKNIPMITAIRIAKIEQSSVRLPMPGSLSSTVAQYFSEDRFPPRDHADIAKSSPNDASIECSRGCFSTDIRNGVCDNQCAVAECQFDAGDCSTEQIMTQQKKSSELCAPLCGAKDLGDGFCDPSCNVESCSFDKGDCNEINGE